LSSEWEHETVAWIAKTLPVNFHHTCRPLLVADSGFKVTQLPKLREINKKCITNFRLLFEKILAGAESFTASGTLVPGKGSVNHKSNFTSGR